LDAVWQDENSAVLTNSPQPYLYLTEPLTARRFYRAWQENVPGADSELHINPFIEITLTGTPGSKVRIEAINKFGATDAWEALETVTLTNSKQVWFEAVMFGQPPRVYRLVPVP
jgi:hypothetical protein